MQRSEDLQFFPVEGYDLIWIIAKQDVVEHPRWCPFGPDHFSDLFAEIGPVPRIEEHVRHARANAELEIAELDADFLQRADTADVEDTKVGNLEPLLSVVA